MSDYPTVRATLVEARDRAGLSQRALASAIGVSTSTLARWETGEQDPSAPNYHAWAAAVGSAIQLGDPLDRADGWLAAMRTAVTLTNQMRDALNSAIEAGPPKGI